MFAAAEEYAGQLSRVSTVLTSLSSVVGILVNVDGGVISMEP
jgi:hypothetical protein